MLEERVLMWYEKTGKKLILALQIILIIYVIIKLHLLRLFAPFIVAWIFAMLLNPFVTWARRTLHLSRAMGTILSMASILSGLLWIIILIVQKLWEQILNLAQRLPQLSDDIVLQLNNALENLQLKLPPILGLEALTSLDNILEQLLDNLSSFLTAFIPTIYIGIAKVPDIILFTVIMFLATFFMTKDYYMIKHFVKAQCSDTIIDRIVVMQKGVLSAIGGYIRTQCILMTMTFTICLVGLFLFHIEYALLLSFIIAFVDALPVFGSGAILIPWAIYQLIVGHYSLTFGLLGVYGVIFVTRQVMEPRILASQIGVYALITIMSVYIGYKSIGVLGMILGPAIVVIIQMLQNVGALPRFKGVKYESSNNQSSS